MIDNTEQRLVHTSTPISEATRVEQPDDRPELGSWWWVPVHREGDGATDRSESVKGDRGDGFYLGCVIEIGSNYTKVEGIRWDDRISLDDFYRLCTLEPDPSAFIRGKVDFFKHNVRKLMGKIQKLCHELGVPLQQALADAKESPTTALAVVHGTDDIKRYSKALTKAKDKTLPELFKEVEEQHTRMATWMKAELIPASAELKRAQLITSAISHKIHTVELYAGLQEELEQVREGDPASVDAKVHLMQRRHYMDEECLVDYQAGGMDFKSIKAFDRWISKDHNFRRIFPHDRCVVAFRIRRTGKIYGADVDTLANFIKFDFYNEQNKRTFLYIRNGQQLWRMETSISFDEELFPKREDTELLGDDELWVTPSERFRSGRERAELITDYHAARKKLARELWEWKRQGKPEDDWYMPGDTTRKWTSHLGTVVGHRSGRPGGRCWSGGDTPDPAWKHWKLVTPENIYYDDAMRHIAQAAFQHNRVAVVIQGLLDRSTCLHPHPPWRIFEPAGFDAGIELVYDVSRALESGADLPDWDGYRAQLNKSIRPGAVVVGQRAAWARAMLAKWGTRWDEWDTPTGTGPGQLDTVKRLKNGEAEFTFTRERRRGKWVPSRPGYRKRTWDPIPMSWWCPVGVLTCISGYVPGDFHMFYDDPRTRAMYLKWAPILLAAEDYHAGKRKTAYHGHNDDPTDNESTDEDDDE